MKSRKYLAVLFALICCRIAASAHAQQSNTVVTITSAQESNVVTRIERFDPNTNRTNIITKTKYYQNGLLVMDKAKLKGAVDLTSERVYHDGKLVMHQAWDSKSKIKQRTFLGAGIAVVTEVSKASGALSDLILFHGKDEGIVAALKRDESGELQMVDSAGLAELQRGSNTGTELINELSSEAGTKNHPK